MIKGVGKQVVVLTNPDSTIYEQAIFILKKAPAPLPADKNMVEEAEKIINSHIFSSAFLPPRRSFWTPLRIVFLCSGISVACAVSVLLFLLL